MPKSYNQLCPIARTLDLIGERWTMLIIREIFLGRRRFAEMAEGLPGISARSLSDRLKSLEAAGVVARRVYQEHPLRAEYELTALGTSLQPVFEAMFDWGIRHRLTASERAAVLRRFGGRSPLAAG